MNLVINGERRDFPAPLSVAALLEALGYAGKRIAVERNGEIVPKSLHGETALSASAVLKALHQQGLDIPCLIVAAPEDERSAIRAMKAGAPAWESYLWLGRLQEGMKRPAEAQASFRKAIRLKPDSAR